MPHAERELKRAEKNLYYWQTVFEELNKVKTKEELEILQSSFLLPQPQRPPNKETVVPVKPYWEYLSKTGTKIWVGKSASGNETLTFHYASGNDNWLHVSDSPGSHVVIHQPQEPLDEETLQDALTLALYHSQLRSQKEGEISLTKVKYVGRLGKKKGLVQIANEKRHFVKLNKERLVELRAHKT